MANGIIPLLGVARTYNNRSDHVGASGGGWASWVDARLVAASDVHRFFQPFR